MPSISQIIKNVAAVQMKTPTAPFIIWGRPGEGKSDCCFQIADNQNIRRERVTRLHLSQFDVVDLGGVPEISEHAPTGERITVFRPTAAFAAFAEGTGPGLIILEEVGQCAHDMQQFVACLIQDRATSTFKLDPEVRIVLTSNRVEDRSGVRPLLGLLNDRVYHQDMVTSLDDWCAWAMSHGRVDHLGIAFLRLRPDLLNAYDPEARSSPTQRSWTKLLTEVPRNLPAEDYLSIAAGKVGEGAAFEWVSAKDMMHKMPSMDAIRDEPTKVGVPDSAAVLFAVATALSTTANENTFSGDMQYVNRLKKEFQTVYVTDVLRLNPELPETETFITWATENQKMFMGGN